MDIRTLAAEAKVDGSLLGLLAANLYALAVAWGTGMSLNELMMAYWTQSVAIGLASFLRMLRLQVVQPVGRMRQPRAQQLFIAVFFLVHYGFFHVAYYAFLSTGESAGEPGSTVGYALCAAGFVANHAYSFLRNLAHDARGSPGIGLLMVLPYARIVPMHITIIFAGALGGGAMLLWAGLKIAADLVMHVVEHHVLSHSRAAQAAAIDK